ncbi:hypothetical protein [Pseudofrankia sp. DC12]|uniref:hypothetical protein n=1 Tax=Pseudofrankia sp. DC12 TaxID=683315 RepID=UPI0005F7ED0C|nr:hypothetical protein [Pseudofrankia sp. DC12]
MISPRAALAALVLAPTREPVNRREAAWFPALAPIGGLLVGVLTGAVVFATRIRAANARSPSPPTPVETVVAEPGGFRRAGG